MSKAPVQRASVEAAETIVPQEQPKRRVTNPFGAARQKLNYPARPGYHRHWFNDQPGRIDIAKQAGYTHVTGNDGEHVKRVVGTMEGGGGLVAYLMEIPTEWWEDDLRAQQARVNEIEAQMKRGVGAGKEHLEPGQYVPMNADGTPRIRFGVSSSPN
ncbi:hypothetical protein [Bradyrhizobium sp. dw_78]|uniref:hypothetical protein n=1 Tax=Bradyrhizobium sp. dw_78 TaxID=2719793 RepID=UPI001BD66BC8|nr:hypothetical protein [Bradyrhizobium sp. dw_78]